MATTITAGTATGGSAISADTSGILEFKTGSTPTTALTIGTNQVVTVVNPIQGGTITSGTAVAASGTSIGFTGIPSWAKRITVMFNGVSTNGSSFSIIQIGSGSVTTTGYTSYRTGAIGSNVVNASLTTGFSIGNGGAGEAVSGAITLSYFNSNIWVCSGNIVNPVAAGTFLSAGSVTLSGALDRVRITTVNGTDTFDAGTINIMYE